MSTTQPQYPEHDKLRAVKDQSQAQGAFLDWLQSEKHYFLATYEEGANYPSSVSASIQKLLAEYHGIDLKKLDAEKDAMLEEHRKLNER